jgi:hypothetical protein
MPTVSVTVKPTFAETYRISLNWLVRTFWFVIWPAATITVLFLMLVAVASLRPPPEGVLNEAWAAAGPFPPYILGLFAFVFLFPLLSARKARSLQNSELGTQYQFSEECVEVIGPLGTGRLQWIAFKKVVENRWLLLLYLQTGVAYPVVKRFFADKSDLLAVRELLRQNIKKAKLRSD